MALRSAVHGLISAPTVGARRLEPSAFALAWAAFLTLVVGGPWLLRGFLFGTDWPGPRRFDLPTDLSSMAPVQVLLWVVGVVVGGEIAAKLLVLGLLFVAGALSFRAVPTDGFLPRAAAATVYVVNPFVYGRLHYGQLFVLAAYAVFPWFVTRFRLLIQKPGLRSALLAAAGVVLLGMFSLHIVLVASLLAAVLLLAHLLMIDEKLAYARNAGPWLLLAAGTALLASAYWLLPLLAGRGLEASLIAQTGSGHLNAYAAVPDRALGLLPNLLGLYGFWAENSGRFTSMKAFVPLWPAGLAAMLICAAVGVISAIRSREGRLAYWAAGLVVAGCLALVLEAGLSHPATAPIVSWLDTHVSLYRGMRDAGKWAVLLAFVYSQLVGLGVAAILTWLATSVRDPIRAEWVGSIAAGLLLALPLYYGNGLLFGAHGEIRPSSYPAGWYAADQVLAADRHPGRALFLPWHEYMSFSFIENENRIVAPPGPTFFSVPVLVSTNPEVPGVQPPTDPDQDAVTQLIRAGPAGSWAQVLAARGVKYVLLARELDWSTYEYLDAQAGLIKVGDYDSIVLYLNMVFT